MKRWLGTLAVLLLVGSPALVAALDAPHDQTFSEDGNCNNCHALWVASPGGQSDFNPGCASCHAAVANSRFGFPWSSSDQASPGRGGNHHSWTGAAVNPARGAKSPGNSALSRRLVDGALQCAVCHDPHTSAPENAPSSLDTSIPVGVGRPGSGSPTGTAQMTLVSPGTAPKGYRIKIQTAGAGGGSFVISHDFGLATPSWFNWSGGAWVPGSVSGPGKPYTNGADVALDDPAVTVRFTAGAAADDYWDFYVSYPFVRIMNAADELCLQCHAERKMGAVRVRGADPYIRPNGVRLFSHPVNEALNSNGKNYDRVVGAVLDADGAPQSTGDGNVTNDLTLTGGVVRCTSCHAPHNADSNSLTKDAR